MIWQHHAPSSAIAPEPIKSDGLFKLDVDDSIWQDVGLGDEDGDHAGMFLYSSQTFS